MLLAAVVLAAIANEDLGAMLPVATLHESDILGLGLTESSGKGAPRSIALLLANTEEGLGSALTGTFRLALDMAARSGAVLIDPLVSEGKIGTLGCSPRKRPGGGFYRSGSGGARLSDYFEYLGPQCPLAIDYDLHAMDVALYPVADKALRAAWRSGLPPNPDGSEGAAFNLGAFLNEHKSWGAFLKERGWMFCDADEHPDLLSRSETITYVRHLSCARDATPPRVQARRSVCVAQSIYRDCDARKLWQSIASGVEARDRLEQEDATAPSEHRLEKPFAIVIAGSVVQYAWNFRDSAPVDVSNNARIAHEVKACMPKPYKVSTVVDAMARAFAETHLGGGAAPSSGASPSPDFKSAHASSTSRDAYWAARRYASVQLRLHHMLLNLAYEGVASSSFKLGEIFTSLDDDFTSPSEQGLANPVEWTVDAANRALVDGVARKEDTEFAAFARSARHDDDAAAPSRPKLRVYVASDIWSDHDGDSEWTIKDRSAKRRAVLDLLRENLLDEFAKDHFIPVRLDPQTMLAPLCDHAAVAGDAGIRAQCVAFVADDAAGAALLLDLTLVRRGRVTAIAGGGGFTKLLFARADITAQKASDRKCRRESVAQRERGETADWCVIEDEASQRLEYRIACDLRVKHGCSDSA